MSKEIERKFLINVNIFNKTIGINPMTSYAQTFTIEQCYFNDELLNFRIRRKTLTFGGVEYFYLTIKEGIGLERNEYETRINNKVGRYLISKSLKKLQKIRYYSKDGWEIDHFINPELMDLWIAEKELKDINEQIILPNYITEEITGKEEYSNYELWKKLKQ